MINIHPCPDKNKNKIFDICSFKVSSGIEINMNSDYVQQREIGKRPNESK